MVDHTYHYGIFLKAWGTASEAFLHTPSASCSSDWKIPWWCQYTALVITTSWCAGWRALINFGHLRLALCLFLGSVTFDCDQQPGQWVLITIQNDVWSTHILLRNIVINPDPFSCEISCETDVDFSGSRMEPWSLITAIMVSNTCLDLQYITLCDNMLYSNSISLSVVQHSRW